MKKDERDARIRDIVRLEFLGLDEKDIREGLGIPIRTLARWKKTEAYKNESKILHYEFSRPALDKIKELREKIQKLAPVALEKVAGQMMTGRSEKVVQAAAFDILDRAGLQPPARVILTDTPEMTEEELREFIIKTVEGDRKDGKLDRQGESGAVEEAPGGNESSELPSSSPAETVPSITGPH